MKHEPGRNVCSQPSCKLLLMVMIAILAAGYLTLWNRPGSGVISAQVLAASTTLGPSTGGCQSPPVISYTIPSDIAANNSQANVNCMAWQEFIALNWQASTSTCEASTAAGPADFGEPNNTAPVVWETYKEASHVFQKGAIPPTAWCDQGLEPSYGSPSATSNQAWRALNDHKTLTRTSITSRRISEFVQSGSSGGWLTDQNGNLVFYEMRINQDEFNYINHNHLYSAPVQEAFAESPGIDLPDGTAKFAQYGKVGSIEFEASWVELPDPSKWPSFKISRAYVLDPNSKLPPRLVTVGLVGLHIVHKTAKAPQFLWATFEHVNNAPTPVEIQNKNLLPWYTFYNKDCNAITDHYHCLPNGQPSTAGAGTLNLPRRPADPYRAPVQVVRENPIDRASFDNVAGLNQWVWNLIGHNNPKSVFLNYQLVGVLWASDPASVTPGSEFPLTSGNPVPKAAIQKVANTTLETYFQTTYTCLDCHAAAPIALARRSKRIASDYSFLFSMADAPASAELRLAK